MKKFFVTLPVLVAISLASCEKETHLPKSVPSKTTSSTQVQEKIAGEPTTQSTWHDDQNGNVEGVNFGCWGDPTNCGGNTVITPRLNTEITDFGNSSSPGTYASAHYSSLSDVIYYKFLDNVIAGTYTVSFRGAISSTSSGYLIFKNSSGVVFVYQLRN